MSGQGTRIFDNFYLLVKSHLRHSFPILSGIANTIETSLIKLYYRWETAEEIIKKKHAVTICKGFSHFQKNNWSQIFFCSFFTQVQVNCFTSKMIPKLEIPFDWLVFNILFKAWLIFDFHYMFVNNLRIIIWNRITKTFITNLVTFVIFLRCPKNVDFAKYLQNLI